MKTVKYSNIEEVLPQLSEVLKQAIQAETLEISRVDKYCSHYLDAKETHPQLETAEFVVYSPYVRETDHAFEHYIFLDIKGKSICHVGATEMELEGVCKACTNLKMSSEYMKKHPL